MSTKQRTAFCALPPHPRSRPEGGEQVFHYVWANLDPYDTGYGNGSTCYNCYSAKNTFRCPVLDDGGAPLCVTCWQFDVRPRIYRLLTTEGRLDELAAFQRAADAFSNSIRRLKIQWEAEIVARFPAELARQEQVRTVHMPYATQELPWPDDEPEDYPAEDDSSSCGCGACEEHTDGPWNHSH